MQLFTRKLKRKVRTPNTVNIKALRSKYGIDRWRNRGQRLIILKLLSLVHRYADARCSILSKMHHFSWAGFSPLIGCSPCSSKPDPENGPVDNVETLNEKDKQDARVAA